jgi:F-type H+-transporting ATPase subunit b
VEARQIVQKAKEEAIIQGKQKLNEAIRQIEIKKQKAAGEIRTHVALLSVSIAEKILRKQLDDVGNNEQMIAQFLDDIENSDAIKN